MRHYTKYDIPFFDYVIRLPGGFDAGIHGVMEFPGQAGRGRRPPFHSLDDAEMEKLADFLKSHHLL